VKLERDMALLIPVSGKLKSLTDSPTLEQAQFHVEGYVEALFFKYGGVDAQALFNEEGLRKEMQPNLVASALVGRPLVGPVIILTGKRRWS